jgi:hypothetical protein
MHPRLGHYIFDWRGKAWLYDSGLGEMLLSDAKSDIFCDQVLCNAGAALLDATGGILETRLRAYVCGRLSGTIPAIKVAKRGNPGKNWGRDAVIVGRLIPPLLDRFRATRNPSTKRESACSIVHKALSRLRVVYLEEKRINGIWDKHKHLVLI